MRFIVDESTGPRVAEWLKSQGFDVFSISKEARGSKDIDVLEKAIQQARILITNDRDFGELIFKNGLPHQGVIFLRLSDETSANKINVLTRLLENNRSLLINENFVIVTEETVRVRKTVK